MSPEDLIEIDRAGRRCSVCRSGRHWRRLNVVRQDGREPVVLCAACRARYPDAPPAREHVEKAPAPVASSKDEAGQDAPSRPPKQHEDRLRKVLRELPRGEHTTGRIAKAAGLNQRKTLARLRQLEASGEIRQVGKRWSTEQPSTDIDGAFDRLQARTSNIRIVREGRSRA